MKKLRLLAVSFDTNIKPWEINRFRGAIARKVGLEHEWFHNHDNAEGGYHYRYPLIQYKIDTQGQEMRPMMLCLDDCIEEAHHLFSQADWSLCIGENHHELRISRLHVDQINLNVWDRPLTYRMHKWRALNSDNFREWQQIRSKARQYAFLDKLLANHITSFSRGIGWELDRRFEVQITDLLKEEWISVKDVKKLAFTIEFQANISLPDYIGLGSGVSEGFGVVRRQGDKRQFETAIGQTATNQKENGR
jgi:hypothetical protein